MGSEWFTTKQFAKHYGLGEATSYRKLMELMDRGELECWYGISFVNRRMMRKWRLKPKKNEATQASKEESVEIFPESDSEAVQASA